MSIPKDRPWFDEGAGYLVRPYTVTQGRTSHDRSDFTLITLVRATGPSMLPPGYVDQSESAAILELCRERPLAVAEVAARLDLPPSVVKVLCGDLLDRSMITIKVPGTESGAPSVELLERVIRGIREL
ncbi:MULTISPECIES: DUF742 domain-containing protein [unclassified Streptomyces]|uniref:DUF742 domain-containing protein n=1 Tax=Streptomyces hazeniae TaxID=3075538 RepID=A0ABU2NU01_9ACTN|nr:MULTISPECIES: DUF742 domain-containing protein [unclassified Streptomyces]MDT0380200.1 DUF742 domain-containing protein [Streptomyces sp. DSM 42041]